MCRRFLWAGTEENTLPWVAWDKIAMMKSWGGCGVKELSTFAMYLFTKSIWRIIT